MNETFIPVLEFQRLQPILFHGEMVWVPGGRDGATLSLPDGGCLPMRPLCPIATVAAHSRRVHAAALAATAAAQTTEKPNERRGLAVFLGAIVPGVERWDSKHGAAACPPTECAEAESPSDSRRLPAPVFPAPSLLVFGRYWRLAADGGLAGLRVFVGTETLVSTGEFLTVRELSANWAKSAQDVLRQFVDHGPAVTEAAPEFGEALAELRCRGAVERGDLLYLGGSPPLLAHVLPGAGRQLAIAAELALPARMPAPMGVFRRGIGRWERDHRAVCFGPDIATPEWGSAASSGVSLALFLRFAAVRFSANGRFHEQE